MAKRRNPHQPRHKQGGESLSAADSDIRIIGGKFRGRRLSYHGDPIVRPMKHRVREAIFNLITTDSVGRHVIDLFAGTGALALEALSRGAAHATLIEKHVPTTRVVEENIRTLGVEQQTTLLTTSAFLWSKRDLPSLKPQRSDLIAPSSTLNAPWLVFCSPPYDFFVEREAEMLELIQRIQEHAPPESTLVVESDERFDPALLGEVWQTRAYPPAVVAIWRKPNQAE